MFYDMEHTISNLEAEIATLSNNNKKLEEELEAKNKIIEGQRRVFKRVEEILVDKACGLDSALRVYIKSVTDTIQKMLIKEGVVEDVGNKKTNN